MFSDILGNVIPVTVATSCSKGIEYIMQSITKIPLPRKFQLVAKGISIISYTAISNIIKQSTYDAAHSKCIRAKLDAQSSGEGNAPIAIDTKIDNEIEYNNNTENGLAGKTIDDLIEMDLV